jgi:hypothetical protein
VFANINIRYFQQVPHTSPNILEITKLPSNVRIKRFNAAEGWWVRTVARDLPRTVRVLFEDKQLLVGFGTCRPGRVKRDGSTRVGTREGPVWASFAD